MKNDKKTEVITFRTDETTKQILEKESKKRDWTVAQIVNNICKSYIENQNPGSIVLKSKTFFEYVEKLKNDKTIEAIEVNIYTYEDDNKINKKYFSIDVIRCGGMVCEDNDDSLMEMTQEEIYEIE